MREQCGAVVVLEGEGDWLAIVLEVEREAVVLLGVRAISAFLPLQLLLTTFAGWVNRHQAQVIDCLVEENRGLKEQLDHRRLRFTDDQRRRLAAKGKALGRSLLARVATIVTPDTILLWHQRLIAAKWTYATKRRGRPGS